MQKLLEFMNRLISTTKEVALNFRERASFWALAGVTLAIHFRLIQSDPFIEADEGILVTPLRSITSWSEYFSALSSGKLFDRQPVRDLSYGLDLKAESLFGLHSFHFSNWLIWILILSVLFKLMRALGFSKSLASFLVWIYGVHPLFVGSVAWVSARKHLLATLFIFWATEALVSLLRTSVPSKRVYLVPILYLLSTVSHPLYLLWPLWAFLFLVLESPSSAANRQFWRNFSCVALCLPLALFIGILNWSYYNGGYLASGGMSKSVVGGVEGGLLVLLAFGRYYFNLVCPLVLAVFYNPLTVYNWVGVGLLMITAILLLKIRARKSVVVWISFFVMAVALVTVHMTPLFVSDTYVLGANLGWLVLLGLCLENYKTQRPKTRVVRAAPVGLVLILSALSFEQAKSWGSNRSVWSHSYATEPSGEAALKAGLLAMDEGRYSDALLYAYRLKEWVPSHPHLGRLLGGSVYFQSGMSLEKKEAILESQKGELGGGVWIGFYLAGIYSLQGRHADAKRVFETAVFPLLDSASLDPQFTTEYCRLCARSGALAECEAFLKTQPAKLGNLSCSG